MIETQAACVDSADPRPGSGFGDSTASGHRHAEGHQVERQHNRKFSIQINRHLVGAETVEEILAIYAEHHAIFDVVNLTTALHRITKRQRSWQPLQGDARFVALLRTIVHTPKRDFNARHLSSTAWAFAAAGVTPPALFDDLAARSLEVLEGVGRGGGGSPAAASVNPQELSSLTWAFTTARVAAPALFKAVAAEAIPRLHEFDPQVRWAGVV